VLAIAMILTRRVDGSAVAGRIGCASVRTQRAIT
jgi:hypothetical protein